MSTRSRLIVFFKSISKLGFCPLVLSVACRGVLQHMMVIWGLPSSIFPFLGLDVFMDFLLLTLLAF